LGEAGDKGFPQNIGVLEGSGGPLSMVESNGVPFHGLIRKINYWCVSLAGLILLFINFSIFVDVILRYFFRRPSIWITEVSTYLFLYIIFLAASYALEQGLHIKVTFLRFHLSGRATRILDLVCSIFAMVFCFVLLWQTSAMTWSAFKENWTSPTILSAPYAYIYVVMVFGSLLLLVTFLLQTVSQFMEPRISAKGGERK
jgi:TRAP-type C4-dicarboxylate transport system permease small subunit